MIRISLDKRYLLFFRITMLALAAPFVIVLLNAIVTGAVTSRGVTSYRSSDASMYYAYVFNRMMFAAFFIWMGTFGSKEKLASEEKSDLDNKK